MSWELIRYNTFTGKYNMDYDLQLVKNCNNDIPILRFYGWNPYCISLGANQSYSDIKTTLTEINEIDIVKRPTGGRAILHSEELTYSVIMPNCKDVSGKELYSQISNAIVYGLKSYSNKLNLVELESVSPNFPTLINQSSGSICFASTAKSEIKFNGKKLVGSAQRKLGDKILQHGSILIGTSHKNLVDYLNINDEMKKNLRNEIDEKTIELETILDKKINIEVLEEKIIEGFEEIFNTSFISDEIEISLP